MIIKKPQIKQKSKEKCYPKIADIYNIPTDNVKKLVLHFILGLKLKKNISRIRIQSISMAKKIL